MTVACSHETLNICSFGYIIHSGVVHTVMNPDKTRVMTTHINAHFGSHEQLNAKHQNMFTNLHSDVQYLHKLIDG